MSVILFFFAFSQTVTTSPLIADFEAQWAKYARGGTISETNLKAWSTTLQNRAKYKNEQEKLKAEDYADYSAEQLFKKIKALEAKGGNDAAIKELVKIHTHLQEARVRYSLEPTSSDLYLAIERYQKMYTHLEAKTEIYLGSFSSKLFAMDVEKAKKDLVGDTWDYNVRHKQYVFESSAAFGMPSDEDLMSYNRAYCECVHQHKKIAIKARRDCAHEVVDTNKACDLFSDLAEQPKPSRIAACGEGKVYIFPTATQYFINGSCTLDLGRAKSFLQTHAPRESGKGAR